MAKETIARIDYVPYILLYVQGKPFMKYNGPHDINELKRFVVEVAKNLQNNQTFCPDKVKDDKRGIPEFCVGHPLYGDEKKCYLEFSKAYGDK